MKRAASTLNRQIAQDFNAAKSLPKSFSMRAAKAADIAEVLSVGQACFAYNSPTLREISHAVMKAHGGVFMMIDDRSGLCAGYILLEAHARRKNLYINTTALREEYRGRGLGRALYDFKDFYARKLGARNIWCHVAEDNAVNIHLMERYGYIRIRREDEYYEDGRAALVMRKDYPDSGKKFGSGT